MEGLASTWTVGESISCLQLECKDSRQQGINHFLLGQWISIDFVMKSIYHKCRNDIT
jgi:hypothetical protein